MESKVYYGEYTLSHWIKLMLTKNIILPDYQRCFVWDEKDIKRFIQSLKEHQFVQPITIAVNNLYDENNNLIIDGQQRLTSILLAYLGYIPDKTKFKTSEDYSSEDDGLDDDKSDVGNNKSIEWTMKELQNSKFNSPEELKNILKENDKYEKLDIQDLNEHFFDETFLGFSYIVPIEKDTKKIQEGYSKLFRSMNYFGIKLSKLESRRSLYFMNDDMRKFFDGKDDNDKDVLCDIRIREDMASNKIDFVKYLSILSQYKVLGASNNIMKGYSAYSLRELFYTDYVFFQLGLDQEDRESKFNGCKIEDLFPNGIWQERFHVLRETISKLKPYMLDKKETFFPSWINADYWLFGVIYYVLFLGNTIIESKEQELATEINKRIKEKRWGIKDGKEVPSNYARNANRLGNVRDRVEDSIEIYKNYVQ